MSVHDDALADANLCGREDVEAFSQWGVAPAWLRPPMKPPGPDKSKLPPIRPHELSSLDDITSEAYNHSLEHVLRASSKRRSSLSSRSVHEDALADADLRGREDVEVFGQRGVEPASVRPPMKPPGPHKSKMPPTRPHELRTSDETISEAYNHSLEHASRASSKRRSSLLSRSMHDDAIADANLCGREDVEAFGQWGVAPASVRPPMKPPGPHESEMPPTRPHDLKNSDETTSEAYNHSSEDALRASSKRRSSLSSRRSSVSSRRSSVVSCHKEIRSRAAALGSRRSSNPWSAGRRASLPIEVQCQTYCSEGAWGLVFHGKGDHKSDRRPDNASISDQEEIRKAARAILRSKRVSLEAEQLNGQLADVKRMPESARGSQRASQSNHDFSLPPTLAKQSRRKTPTSIDSPEIGRTEAISQHSPVLSHPERVEMCAAAMFQPPGWH